MVSNQVKIIYIAHFLLKEIRCGGRERERDEGAEDKWSVGQKERLEEEGLRDM